MNILDTSAINNCTSCGVCASVCARKAVSMQLDENGFYRPVIDYSFCNDCGLCTTVCYKFDSDVKQTSEDQLEEKKLYAAWAKDEDIIRKTTSGGIADILAHALYDRGYKVVGVVYNKAKDRAEHRLANTDEDLIQIRGSKYIQSYTFEAFKEIVANCRKEKYAVFGTPCQIYALNKMTTKKRVRDNFVFIDLYCHGCPSMCVWTKYKQDITKKIGSNNFSNVVFRSKKRGWGTGYTMEINTADGKSYLSKKAKDSFYELFFSDYLLNESCYDCKMRSTLEYTDIRLGDFWGKKFVRNHRGVSGVSVATAVGGGIFGLIEKEIEYQECGFEDLHPWQSWNVTYPQNKQVRDAVLCSLRSGKEDIYDAVKTLREGQGLKKNIIREVKAALSYLPQRFTDYIRIITYALRN